MPQSSNFIDGEDYEMSPPATRTHSSLPPHPLSDVPQEGVRVVWADNTSLKRRERDESGPKVRLVESNQDAFVLERLSRLQDTVDSLTKSIKQEAGAFSAQSKDQANILDHIMQRLERLESLESSKVPLSDAGPAPRSESETPMMFSASGLAQRESQLPQATPHKATVGEDLRAKEPQTLHDTELPAPRHIAANPWTTQYTTNRLNAYHSDKLASYKTFRRTFEEDGDDKQTLPLPKRFLHPKGGAGPKIRMLGYDAAPGEDSSSRTNRDEGNSDAGMTLRGANLDESIQILQKLSLSSKTDGAENIMALTVATLGKVATAVDAMHGRQTSLKTPASSKIFPKSPQRITDVDRTTLLNSVRTHMNLLLNIQCDEDIVNSDAVLNNNDEEVAEYEAVNTADTPEPVLFPLRPSWLETAGKWNTCLSYEFQNYMISQVGLPRYQGQQIREAFLARLGRLRRVVKKNRHRPGETEEEWKKRVQGEKLIALKGARVNTRRFHLNVRRLEVSHGMRDDTEEVVAWAAIARCVEALTADGMSSDDSDGEGGTRTVRRLPWRSKAVSDVVRVVDQDATRTTPRIRRVSSPRSRRNAPPSLPINFYNPVWISQLTPHERYELKDRPALPIPDIQVV